MMTKTSYQNILFLHNIFCRRFCETVKSDISYEITWSIRARYKTANPL